MDGSPRASGVPRCSDACADPPCPDWASPRPPISPRTPQQRTRTPCRGRRFAWKSVDPPALSRVSFNPSLTSGKRRKEGTWGQRSKSGPRLPPSRCRAMAAAACRWPISRAASSSFISTPGPIPPAAPARRSIFRGLRAEFHKAGTDILGVSADPVKAQDAFKKKHDLTIALALRRDPQDARSLWRLGRKIHVRQEVSWGSSGPPC